MDRQFSFSPADDVEGNSMAVITEEEEEESPVVSGRMSRSASEWAFQKFLNYDGSEIPSEDGEGDHKTLGLTDPLPHGRMDNLSAPLSPLFGEVGDELRKGEVPPPTDPRDHQTFLKRRLNLACAAVAFTRVTGISSPGPGPSTVDANQSQNTLVSEGRAASLVSQSSATDARAIYIGAVSSTGSGPIGIPALPPKPKGGNTQVRTTSGSSREQSDDDDQEVGPSEQSMDPSHLKRVRRKLSNRESARRSRRRKQAHLNDLEIQVAQLRVENSSLFKRFTEINQKYSGASVDNRVLKSDVEALRAKVKMVESMVPKAATAGFPFQNTSQVQSAVSLRYTTGIFDSPATNVLQGEDGLYMNTAQSTGTGGSSLSCAISDMNQQNKELQIQHTGSKMGRTPSMQRVASLEHLQKRIRGGITCGSMPWGGAWDVDGSQVMEHSEH